MADKLLNSRLSALNQVGLGRTAKYFEDRQKPYARPLFARLKKTLQPLYTDVIKRKYNDDTDRHTTKYGDTQTVE